MGAITGPAFEWHEGSTEALLLLGHPTGFCKEIWRPVVSELRQQGVGTRALAWDARGHGSAPPFDSEVDWWTFGHDLVDLIDRLSPSEPVVGIGHSMGGATMAMCDLIQPGLLAGMFLIEPVIIPPAFRRSGDVPLAVKAAKRRPTFPSRRAAATTYRSKPLFQSWHEDAFAGYLEGGLVPHPDGVALACPPKVESAVFAASTRIGLWERLPEVTAPARLVMSGNPGKLGPLLDGLAEQLPDARISYLEDQGHMVVMERPDLVAAGIADFLGEL